ncbi:hypothetical protein NUSPORA_02485 [Nucleospora cyclopteri]
MILLQLLKKFFLSVLYVYIIQNFKKIIISIGINKKFNLFMKKLYYIFIINKIIRFFK